jgi:hypothetical protein
VVRVSRDQFRELAAGAVGPNTRVFDNTLRAWAICSLENGMAGGLARKGVLLTRHWQLMDW